MIYNKNKGTCAEIYIIKDIAKMRPNVVPRTDDINAAA